ncbi:MAG: hypothetical protein EAZ92_03330 [Candidatus Kapaibacterium sp.]|nr:MAG: hypothetical protein EAZ92_03330 [Candidatus Kapabacteria bacterium]
MRNFFPFLTALLFCIFPKTAIAQSPINPRFDDEYFLKARIYFHENFDLEAAEESGVEVEHSVIKGKLYVEGVISRTTLQVLRSKNVRVQVLVEDAAKEAESRAARYFQRTSKEAAQYAHNNTPRNFKLGSMAGFFRLTEIYAEFAKMREMFPRFVSAPEAIGTSVEGAPIQAYRICSPEAASEKKPEILYTSVHHAREPGGAASLIYYAWWLLEQAADGNAEAQYLLRHRQLFLVPMVNPDGYLWNQSTNPNGGGMWRKNRRLNHDGSYGVDLNRNYGTNTFWNAPNNGSSTNPRSDTYRGTEAFSEPETQALRDFCERRAFRTAINFHTFSNLLIYPYSYIDRETPDSTYFRALTAEITKDNLYSAGRDMQTVGYAVRGGSDDWMYAGLSGGRKIMAYTPEVGTPDDGFWPSPDRIIPQCAENLSTNRMTAWSAAVNLRPVQSYVRENPQSGATRLVVEVQNIGIQNAQEASSLSARALVRGVSFVRSERSIRALRSTELVREVFDMVFDSNINNGAIIPTEIIITQEQTPRRDTVFVQVREAERVNLFSEAKDTDKWQLGRWAAIADPLTGAPALTDSPQGLYRSNDNNFVQLARPVSLAGLRSATLEYQARWSVESNGDLAVVQVSDDNGLSWRYLRTSLMKPGTFVPSVGEQGFGYDGNFPQWIRQEYPLDAWLGKNVLIRFGIISDNGAVFDGMYVRDMALRLYRDSLSPRIVSNNLQAPRLAPNTIEQGNEIRIDLPLMSLDTPVDVRLVNAIGQQVLQLTGINAANDGTIFLPTSTLARGLYIAEIRMGTNLTREKVLLK